MGIAPFTTTECATGTVDEMVGTAYKVVRHVSEHIEYIKHVSAHMAEIYRLVGSIDAIDAIMAEVAKLDTILANLEDIVVVGDNIASVVAVANNVSALIDLHGSLPELLDVQANLATFLAELTTLTDLEYRVATTEGVINGLGSAAAANTGDFATAAQGALADTAVQPEDIDALDVGVTVATRAALKDLDTTKDTLSYLKEAGREGWFKWTTGEYSSQITADTADGIYIKADTVAATSGAWVRVVKNNYLATWFGLVEGEDSGNHTAIKNAIVMAAGVFPVVIPPGDYTLTAGITNNQANTHIIGYGATIRANFAGIPFRSLDPYPRFKVEGLTLDGMNIATRGIWIGSDHPHIYNNEVKGFIDAGILIAADPGQVSDNPRVHNNYVHDNPGIGIGFSRASRAAAIGNIIRNSGLHAMTMDNVGGTYNIVANNIMDTACTVAGSAVFATDLSQHLIVANNHIANGTTWGITTPNNEGHTDGMIIVGNALVNNASGGIKLLRNNAPTGAGAPGPVLCSNCLIDVNTFVNNGPSKISIVIDDMGTTLGPNKIGANNLYRDSALPSYPSRTLGTPVTFFATYSSDQADVTGDGTDFTMVPNNATLNEGGGYNNATGVFTAPRTGLYEFTAGAALAGVNSAVHTNIIMTIITSADGNWRSTSAVSAASGTDGGQVKSPPLRLTAGDTVESRVRVVGSSKVVDLTFTGGYTFFAGRLVHEW